MKEREADERCSFVMDTAHYTVRTARTTSSPFVSRPKYSFFKV